jgi:hypothetical protein
MKTSKDFEDFDYCAECDSSSLEEYDTNGADHGQLICGRGHIFYRDEVRTRSAQDQYEDYGDMKFHEQNEENGNQES